METPSKGRVATTVVHVTVYTLTINFLNVNTEELGYVLIGRPVQRYAQIVTVTLLELLLKVFAIKPVRAEPVEVGELLGGQLVHFSIRAGGVLQTDEIIQVQARVGVILPLVFDSIGDGNGLAVTQMSADS